jgi:hypothetical protein
VVKKLCLSSRWNWKQFVTEFIAQFGISALLGAALHENSANQGTFVELLLNSIDRNILQQIQSLFNELG